MENGQDFTRGKITGPLLKFALPVFLALVLQSLYGAADLWVVGRFAENADVSAVSTGSQLMMMVTGLVSSFAMGVTVLLGHRIGEGRREEGGRVAGTGIMLFLIGGAVLSLLLPLTASPLVSLMNAPKEAHAKSVSYVTICGAGSLVIIAYNLIGSIFRGIGDSKTPLVTVGIACAFNILGDVFLVKTCGLGAAGAAIATVSAQLLSVLVSLALIRKKTLPFTLKKSDLKLHGATARQITKLGLPIALQDFLVGVSFLVLLSIVNSLGLLISAGVGVAEKVCAFIMLIPSAFGQAMAAFVAQNVGAGRYDRAKRALVSAIAVSAAFGVVMFVFNFFFGTLPAGIFTKDPAAASVAAEYLKAYAVDCLLTCFLFCFIGFFNGLGYSAFVMRQGVIGAFLVRIPVAFLMSRRVPFSLFMLGLSTPCSTLVHITMCFFTLRKADRRLNGPSVSFTRDSRDNQKKENETHV